MEETLMNAYDSAFEDVINSWIEEGLSESEILQKLEHVDFEKPMSEIISIASKDMMDFARANMFEIAYGHKAENAEFDAHQELLWGKCFIASETMYVLAVEAAELYSKFVDENIEEDHKILKQYTFLALQHIHGRACQQYLEIICLMKHGFADGAYARWRSMYELSCIGEFIRSNGEEIAKQYYLQSQTEDKTYTWVKNAPCFAGRNGTRFTFQDIQNNCDFVNEVWEKQYRLACFVNHASPQGTFKRLSNGKTLNQIPIGQSDYGITTTAEHSAISLQLITTLFLTIFPELDGVARCRFLRNWVDVIRELYFSTSDDAFKDIDNEEESDGCSK